MASGTTFTLREPNSLARLLWMVRAMTSSYQVKEGSKKSQKLKSDSYYWNLMVEKKSFASYKSGMKKKCLTIFILNFYFWNLL